MNHLKSSAFSLSNQQHNRDQGRKETKDLEEGDGERRKEGECERSVDQKGKRDCELDSWERNDAEEENIETNVHLGLRKRSHSRSTLETTTRRGRGIEIR